MLQINVSDATKVDRNIMEAAILCQRCTIVVSAMLHQPFIDCAWSQMVTLLQNTAEHTPETENLSQKKITTSVIRNIGYGPVRGHKQPPINEGEK